MNTPKIRFPGFGGEREEKKLGEFISIKSGKYDSQKCNENLKCIELEHLESESGRLLGFINSKQTNSTKNLFKKHQVLFGKLRPYLKKFYFTNFDGVCSSEIWVMTGKEVENKFLYYFIQTDFFGTLTDKSTGSKMPRADWSIISNEIGSLPSLEEQKKIADFLLSVDEKINNLANQLEKWKEYKKGIMQKIFSQKIRFKKENGENFDDWQEKKLGDIAKITTGSSNREDSILDGKYTFFDRSQEIRTSNIFLFDTEAIIFPGEGMNFIPKYFIGKFDLHQRAYAIMDFKSVIGKYLFYFMNFNKQYFLDYAVGSTVKSLRLPIFQNMKITLPTIEEQEKISEFLTSIDEKIENIEKQLEKSKTWKKGLLQNLFV